MSGFADSVLGGAQKLIRKAIQSPNYVAGTTGWTINKDGTVEFNNGTFRGTVTAGTFQGTNFVINSAGAFFYSGTPAAGNLVVAIASTAGTDPYGNGYGVGITLLDTLNPAAHRTLNLLDTDLVWFATQYIFGPQINTILASTNAQSPGLVLSGGTNDNTLLSFVTGQLSLYGGSADGTATAWNQIGGVDDNTGVLQRILTQVIGQLVATSPTATPGTTRATAGMETWHTPAMGSGWATGPFSGGYLAIRYRIDTQDNLVIQGSCHTTSATPAATLFTLPAGWRPVAPWRGPGAVENNSGTPTVEFVDVATTGAVTLGTALAASGKDIYFDAEIPLGNIS
jgi:hypothetical protein